MKSEILEPEVINQISTTPQSAIEAIERAEVDIQIATAHRFPRSLEAFHRRAKDMVSVDQETAESCIYRRPVGKEGGKLKTVEGESIRLAEIVAASYGNLRVAARIIEQTDRYVKAEGIAHDLETNYAARAETIESTVDKYGKPFSERMRIVVAKAALSKGIRDAIFRVVPKSLCKPIIESAWSVINGNTLPLEERKEKALQWTRKSGISDERVFAALGVGGISEIGETHLDELTGLRTAIKEGDSTLDEAFPPISVKPNFTAKPNTEKLELKGHSNLTNNLPAKDSAEIPPSEMSIEQIRSQLEKSGCEEKALIAYLLKEGLLPKVNPTLGGLTDDRAFMIVKGFETIIEKIKEAK